MGPRCLLCVCPACRSGAAIIGIPGRAVVQRRSSQQIGKCSAVWEFLLQNGYSTCRGKKSLLDFPALIEREREHKGRQEIILSFFLFPYSFKQHNKLMPPGFETALWADLLEQTFIQYLWLLALAGCCNSQLFGSVSVPCQVYC